MIRYGLFCINFTDDKVVLHSTDTNFVLLIARFLRDKYGYKSDYADIKTELEEGDVSFTYAGSDQRKIISFAERYACANGWEPVAPGLFRTEYR